MFNIGRKLFSKLGLFYLKRQGLEIGKGLVLLGWPRINHEKGSSIIIGNNVALASSIAGNPLGLNHRVFLSTIFPDSQIIIDNDCGLSGTSLCAAISVKIGKCCLFGANVTITDFDFHPINPLNRRYNHSREQIGAKAVVVEDNVWLGMNVIVLKGVTIGQNSIIAAGSVVTHDIPENCIAGGNPAKIIKYIN